MRDENNFMFSEKLLLDLCGKFETIASISGKNVGEVTASVEKLVIIVFLVVIF